MLEGYQFVRSFRGRQLLIATWRLEALDPQAIHAWITAGVPPHLEQPFPTPDPAIALLTRGLLEAHPPLLETYLDLELSAELFGGTPDTTYVQRLNGAVADSQALLESWWQPLNQLETIRTEHHALRTRAEALEGEMGELREEGEQRRRQLHQTQEELARLFATDQEKAERIAGLQASVEQALTQVEALEEALRRARDGEAALRTRAETWAEESGQLREEREGLLRQLHQAQQELERIFLSDQDKAIRIGELQAALDNQFGRVQALEVDLARIAQERDGLAKERDGALARAADLNQQLSTQMETLTLLREVEGSLHARAAALDGENQKRQEEIALTTHQLQQTQEELERYFLLAQSSEQLVIAQQEQLQRAQSLMSRLLCQVARDQVLPPALAVEVLPPAAQPSRLAGAQRPSLYGKEGKKGWASDLLRRVKGH
ncbi:MAG: hypothetical protein VKP70_09955 [Cyanobacteriota bacterium]|nr:hypothetical protein [Cyanobacteriota bacterium]